MKKLTAVIATLTLALTLAACGGGSGGTYTGTIPDAMPAQESATTPAPTPEPAPDNGGEAANPASDQTPASEPLVINGVGDIVEFGSYEWRALELSDGKALLLCEYVLEKKPYNVEETNVTWETCTLRAYLNDEFYNSFGEGERTRIAQTRVSNKDNQAFGTSGGNDTDDYIFLLSLEEVMKYLGDSGQLTNGVYTIDDEYNEARTVLDINGDFTWWRLRSPGENNGCAVVIDGGRGMIGVNGAKVNFDDGVRPALWLNLD
jgi:hypothetical protein